MSQVIELPKEYGYVMLSVVFIGYIRISLIIAKSFYSYTNYIIIIY